MCSYLTHYPRYPTFWFSSPARLIATLDPSPNQTQQATHQSKPNQSKSPSTLIHPKEKPTFPPPPLHTPPPTTPQKSSSQTRPTPPPPGRKRCLALRFPRPVVCWKSRLFLLQPHPHQHAHFITPKTRSSPCDSSTSAIRPVLCRNPGPPAFRPSSDRFGFVACFTDTDTDTGPDQLRPAWRFSNKNAKQPD